MRYRNKLIKNTFYSSYYQVISLFCNLVLTPIIIQFLGLKKFGIWTIFYVILSYFLLLDMGLSTSYVKFLAEYHTQKDFNKINYVTNTGFLFNIAVFGPLFLLIFLFKDILFGIINISSYDFENIRMVFGGLLIVLFINIAFSSYLALLNGIQCLQAVSIIGMVAIVLKTLLAYLLLRNGWDLNGLLICEFINAAIINISSIFYAKIKVPEMKFGLFFFRIDILKQMFLYGLKLQISQIAYLIYQQADKLLITHLHNVSSVSFYQIGQQIANILRTATFFIGPTVLPAAAELKALSDKEGIEKLNRNGLKYISLITFSLSGFIFVTADHIVLFWLKSAEFSSSITLLKFFIISFCLARISGFWGTIGRGIGIVDIEMKSSLLLIIIQIPLNFLLISRFGFVAAGYGLLVSTVISQLYYFYLFKKKSGIMLIKENQKVLLKISIGVCLAGFCVYYVHQLIPQAYLLNRISGLLVLGTEFMLFYSIFIGFLWLLRVINREDLLMMRTWKQR